MKVRTEICHAVDLSTKLLFLTKMWNLCFWLSDSNFIYFKSVFKKSFSLLPLLMRNSCIYTLTYVNSHRDHLSICYKKPKFFILSLFGFLSFFVQISAMDLRLFCPKSKFSAVNCSCCAPASLKRSCCSVVDKPSNHSQSCYKRSWFLAYRSIIGAGELLDIRKFMLEDGCVLGVDEGYYWVHRYPDHVCYTLRERIFCPKHSVNVTNEGEGDRSTSKQTEKKKLVHQLFPGN